MQAFLNKRTLLPIVLTEGRTSIFCAGPQGNHKGQYRRTPSSNVSRETLIYRSKSSLLNSLRQQRNIRGQHTIMIEHWHIRTNEFVGKLHTLARLQRFAELQHLGGTEQFDSNHLTSHFQNTLNFVCASDSHADEIFHAS